MMKNRWQNICQFFPYISIPKNQEYGVIPGQVLSVTSVCNPKLYSPCDYRHSVVHCHIIWGGGMTSKGPLLYFFQMFQGLLTFLRSTSSFLVIKTVSTTEQCKEDYGSWLPNIPPCPLLTSVLHLQQTALLIFCILLMVIGKITDVQLQELFHAPLLHFIRLLSSHLDTVRKIA